ncbi:MAG TPA: shikimate kinase, partial [Polyangia bacterium]|nr:shikimate kinase [Polyangia bacterium]
APIFLVGFMGSGKTTIGRLLAARLGWSFADLDDRIVRAAGMPIPEIFAREGEPAFRGRETDALRAAAAERRIVLETGGGAACRDENLTVMRGAGRLVALAVSAGEAVRRAGRASGRPLLDGAADPQAAATALLAAREPFYAQADFRVETDGRPPAEIVKEIAAQLAEAARAATPHRETA